MTYIRLKSPPESLGKYMHIIGDAPVSYEALIAMCDGSEDICYSQNARERMEASRLVLEQEIKAGRQIYGINSGFLDTKNEFANRLLADEFQTTIIRLRMSGTGPTLPEQASRMALLALAISLSSGASGVSAPVAEMMLKLLNAGITPVIPSRGSVGATDIGLISHLIAPAIGRGEVFHKGRRMPSATALFDAGLEPVELSPFDGVTLINASSVSTGYAAWLMDELSGLLNLSMCTAALCFEAFGANPEIFGEEVNRLRAAPGQVQAAAAFRAILADSFVNNGKPPRRVHNAASFRTLIPITGCVMNAAEQMQANIHAEVNGSANSPVVLLESGRLSTSSNFYSGHIAITADLIRLSLAHVSNGLVNRVLRLLDKNASGLPRNLSTMRIDSSGYGALQRLAAYLNAEIRLKAAPASLDGIPIFDGELDSCPQTMLSLNQLGDSIDLLFELVAIEAVIATQALDMRGNPAIGSTTAKIYARVRENVEPLSDNREVGSDVTKALRGLRDRSFIDSLLSSIPTVQDNAIQ